MPKAPTDPQHPEKTDRPGRQDEDVGMETEEETLERLRPPEKTKGVRDAVDASFEPGGDERTAS